MSGAANAGSGPAAASDPSAIAIDEPSDVLRERPRGDVVGWNFLFLGGTTLLTSSYIGSEKAVVRGLNDFLVFGTVTVTVTVMALGSGALHQAFGWDAINLVMAPFIAVAFGSRFWLHRRVESNSRAVQPT